jgi:hypothetical protein
LDDKSASPNANDQHVLWDLDPDVFSTIMPRRAFTPDTVSSRLRLISPRRRSSRANCRVGLLNLVQEWAMIHREELQEDLRLCRDNAQPNKVEPRQ